MSEAVLERALTDLGRHLAWPQEPDLTSGVLDGIAGVRPLPVPVRRPVPRRRVVVLAAATLALVLGGMVALSPGIRAAILRFFGVPGVRIERVETPPPSSPTGELDLGRRVTLDEAAAVNFELAVPAVLGEPDRVHLGGFGYQPIVSMVYEPRTGLPAAEGTGVGAVLSQFRATTDEDLLAKLTDSGVTVESVNVNGELGYWVEGPHSVLVLDENGNPFEDRARLAGNTLLWTRDGITYRLEADIDKEAALSIARSVR